MKRFILFFIIVILCGILAYFRAYQDISFNYDSVEQNNKTTKISNTKTLDIPMQEGVKSAHSSSTIMLSDGSLLTAFFAGSREGAKDVKIYANIQNNGAYKDTFVLLDRQTLIKDSKEYIKKLGNPVFVKLDDKIHFFVVGVSFGGWANSKIYHYIANEKDLQFHYKQALNLSPFINTSNLVRTNATTITFADNSKGFVLPIYHELANKFPLALIFDGGGGYLQAKQISTISGLFQPSMIAISKNQVLFTFRADKNVDYKLYTMMCDNSLNCEKPVKTNLLNKDNSINLFMVNNDIYLLYNSDDDGSRKTLSLAKMKNPSEFEKILDIDNGKEKSYASVVVDDNISHISYTNDREFIRYKSFLFE